MNIFTHPSGEAEAVLDRITGRGLGYTKKEMERVEGILEDVRKNGDQALMAYTNRFDAPDLTIESLRVTDNEIDDAFNSVDDTFLAALEHASRQIDTFHQQQMPNSWIDTKRPGTLLGQLVLPVETAGIYTPGAKGGRTPLVSSVLMGAIPAKIAGVKNILMMTPPRADGTIDPHLLVAARQTGINAVFKAGSAWAIAALAYGTETVPKADVIVGPGNIYVTLAKKIVSGTVGIDMIAGPSEILVIADKTANPDFCAADLLSQAEHDAHASSILITDSFRMAKKIRDTVLTRIKDLNRKEIAQASIRDFGAIFVVKSLDAAMNLANRIAPEHLELQIKDPMSMLGSIKNAGAVFLGHYTPEPVGDYIAGPNHVLPTAGTARFSSALSVENFIKRTSLIKYSKNAFEREAADIIRLTEIEGLDAHGASVKVRIDNS